VIGPLLDREPSNVVVANRTKDKAVSLAKRCSDHGEIHGCGIDEVLTNDFDIIINASATSLSGSLPAISPKVFTHARLAYDMAYGSERTAFQVWAQQNGAERSVDGLGMLVEQAAESFEIWHGVRPITASVIEQIRNT